jgi:hypothetical protein|tara:strand:+ start:2021 stop:2398 length:378 start_codon:yes stop_codon:yes gene_type:complete
MTKSAKAKGRLGQQEVRDKLLETFPDLHPDDIKSTVMGDSGEDIQLSPAARKIIPLSIEVKRRKNDLRTVYNYIDQASSHKGGEPVVFYRSDRKPWVVMIGMEHYMSLLKVWSNATKENKNMGSN